MAPPSSVNGLILSYYPVLSDLCYEGNNGPMAWSFTCWLNVYIQELSWRHRCPIIISQKRFLRRVLANIEEINWIWIISCVRCLSYPLLMCHTSSHLSPISTRVEQYNSWWITKAIEIRLHILYLHRTSVYKELLPYPIYKIFTGLT